MSYPSIIPTYLFEFFLILKTPLPKIELLHVPLPVIVHHAWIYRSILSILWCFSFSLYFFLIFTAFHCCFWHFFSPIVDEKFCRFLFVYSFKTSVFSTVWTTVSTCEMETSYPRGFRLSKMLLTSFVTQRLAVTLKTM